MRADKGCTGTPIDCANGRAVSNERCRVDVYTCSGAYVEALAAASVAAEGGESLLSLSLLSLPHREVASVASPPSSPRAS